LLLFVKASNSQQSRRYSFTHYGTGSGLASNEIMDVIQDDDGYMWIATTNGLQRFDGVRFITFRNRKNDPASIPANFVSQLIIDKHKNLWIQAGGIYTGIFDRRTFKFRQVTINPSQESFMSADKNLVQDGEGNMFMTLWNVELLTYNSEKNEFSPAHNFVHLPEGWRVTGFTHLPGTKKYVVSSLKGTAVFNKQTNQLSYPGHNVERSELVEKIGNITSASSVFVDSKNRIWFESWESGSSRLYCYDLKNNSLLLYRYSFQPLVNAYHELKGILEQRNGDIWIRGLSVFAHYKEDKKEFQLVFNGYENEQSISYNKVNGFFEDREGNIWVCTDINGLYRFNPNEQYFTNVRQISPVTGRPGNGSTMSFMYTREGTLLVGTWEDGLHQFDRNYNPIPLNMPAIQKVSPTPSIWSMWESKDRNTIWMGAQPGIWRVDLDKQSATHYNPELLKNRTVRQIAEDKFGNLWIGTQSLGLFKWTAEKGKRNFDEGVSFFTGVPAGMISKITIDKDGFVWISTTGSGSYVIDPATNKVVMHFGTKEPEERKLQWDAVVASLQYDDTTMIIAANSLAIFNTQQKKITTTIQLPELVSGSIRALERDRQGYVWMSTTSGIYRINIRSKIFIQFDRRDGIVNDRFINAASYVLPDGRILFGADNQFVSFDPQQVQINNSSPDIKITGFKLANESLQMDSLLQKKRVELAPGDNSIAIEFSGLTYNNTYLIRYKLEGLEKDWKIADKNSQAIYSYLPPANYTFLVQSEDAEGHSSQTVTRLSIVVNPPFWKTWWFFCLLALVVAAVFYWLDKQRVNKILALQHVRTEIASSLHDEVNTTLNNINLLSEMARIKADKDIDRSKEFIDEISHKSHSMILAMDDILWSIDPQNDSMEKSLLRLMEFVDVMKNLFGARIEIALDKKVRSLNLDMKTRHDVFLIFKEALRIIVEFSGGRQTLIHIDLFRNKLSIKLQDGTAKLEKNEAKIDSSIKEMNSKAALINADIDVQYDMKGIAIILLVPVR
jgi:ligand-binding sensor domain-containing protein/signal transduction histidine kinase